MNRREFLAALTASLAAQAVWLKLPRSAHSSGQALGHSPAQSRAAGQRTSAYADCPVCEGPGRITCPACDGTAQWTAESDSAGLYQKLSARASGRCAWRNEWGEAECPACDGTGAVPIRSALFALRA